MDEKNDLIHLYTLPWEVPTVPQPTSSIVLNVSTAVCRAVLKKNSAVRIPSVLSKPESIIVKPEALIDYHTFSTYIKTAAKCLDIKQNVIFFSDFEDEHKFLFDISCIWAIMHEKTEVNMVAISLNADLTSRLVTWKIISPDVTEDLIPPLEQNTKKQSIASLQATSSFKRKHKAIEIFNEEDTMDFCGPLLRRSENEVIMKITVWKRYVPLLCALNSLFFTIDNQFLQINRTIPLNEDIVSDICRKILEDHSINEES